MRDYKTLHLANDNPARSPMNWFKCGVKADRKNPYYEIDIVRRSMTRIRVCIFQLREFIDSGFESMGEYLAFQEELNERMKWSMNWRIELYGHPFASRDDLIEW